MRQVFIGRNPALADDMAFERKLYVIRKRAYSEIRAATIGGAYYAPQYETSSLYCADVFNSFLPIKSDHW